jgi:hypothetical protein
MLPCNKFDASSLTILPYLLLFFFFQSVFHICLHTQLTCKRFIWYLKGKYSAPCFLFSICVAYDYLSTLFAYICIYFSSVFWMQFMLPACMSLVYRASEICYASMYSYFLCFHVMPFMLWLDHVPYSWTFIHRRFFFYSSSLTMLPNTTRLFHQYCIFDSILDCVSTLIGSCTGPLPRGKVGGQPVAGALGWEVVGWICSVTHVASASPSHPPKHGNRKLPRLKSANSNIGTKASSVGPCFG